MLARLLVCSLLLPFLGQAAAQINAYAEVTGISGNTLYIGSSDETYASFEVGEKAIIMQMQDDVIGSIANDATFGTLGDIQRAGTYVIVNVSGVSRTAGALTSVTLSNPPLLDLNFGPHSAVQLISFQRLGNGNHTTTEDITALPWNGSIGGVVAINVQSTFTVAHNITADGAGFRGGAREMVTSTTCDGTTWSASSSTRYAMKGEGIYRTTTAAHLAGKGHLLNAGGGGNDHNGGGGGGGNYTSGGQAGTGYNCGGVLSGGSGGIGLSAQISGERVFMGGGGGGGEGNNSVSTSGGNGGGIILIHANAVNTSGCTALVISANGAAAANAGNDGAGGGGGGGSVVIQSNGIIPAPGCSLTIRANGGNGGSVGNSSSHGGGGGGGQGTIQLSSAVPSGSITLQTNNGTGGCNNNSSPCNSRAGSGSGSNGAGIVDEVGTPMPVQLLSFTAHVMGEVVDVRWTTASEHGSALFTIERSRDGALWEPLVSVPAAGNSVVTRDYAARDPWPYNGLSYYRLTQLDHDGSIVRTHAVPVQFARSAESLRVVPNPTNGHVMLALEDGPATVVLYDALGRQVLRVEQAPVPVRLDIAALPAGIYEVKADRQGRLSQGRIIKE